MHRDEQEPWASVRGVVERGHQVASRASRAYPRGTIEMQAPFFAERGLDLSRFFFATLNVSIAPKTVALRDPQHTFRQVRWTSLHPPEDFSFARCRVVFDGTAYDGWIYYPHPETKERHFQDPSILEIMAPYISGIRYGDAVDVEVNTAEVAILP